MLKTSTFLPIEAGELATGSNVAPGRIAFAGSQELALIVELDGIPLSGVLSGDQAGLIINPGAFDEAALAIEDWRLEVDPGSIVPPDGPQGTKGQAFRNAGGHGLVMQLAEGGMSPTCYILPSGQRLRGGGRPRLFFARWRIVTGPEDRPFVIATSPEPGK